MAALRTAKALQKGLLGGIVSPLNGRSLLLVEGTDAYKFLNGLVTQEIVNDGETSCKYGAFLNVKGNDEAFSAGACVNANRPRPASAPLTHALLRLGGNPCGLLVQGVLG